MALSVLPRGSRWLVPRLRMGHDVLDGAESPSSVNTHPEPPKGFEGEVLDTVEQRFNVLSEELAVEGAYGIDGQVDGGRSLLALGN